MIRLLTILLLALVSCATSIPAENGESRRFELYVGITRTDGRRSQFNVQSPPVTSESEMTLFGRVEGPDGPKVAFYADSILYQSSKPFSFQTFMSADTIYYRTSTGAGQIDRSDSGIDSLLQCVFGGKALEFNRNRFGGAESYDHANERCRSGEYEKINAPVTLGAFLLGLPDEGGRWTGSKPTPSFSGVGFHPDIEWLFRTVRKTDSEITVTVAADSTIEDFTTVMKSGEEVVIDRDRIRVGGTMTIDRSTGLPRRAELRVGESLRLIRPHAAGMIVTREGRYTIRYSVSD